MKLLGEDLQERLFATLQERCEYMELMTGLSVSRSTMCRAIARIGPTRKKGASRDRARRVLKGGLASDGGRGGRTGEAPLRGGVWDAHLPGAALRLRTQGRAITAFGAAQAGQEHDLALEHELGGDGPVPDGGGSDHRRGLRGVRGAGASSEPSSGAGSGHG